MEQWGVPELMEIELSKRIAEKLIQKSVIIAPGGTIQEAIERLIEYHDNNYGKVNK
jgi:hypothetical protein